jgi:hypothetical protein
MRRHAILTETQWKAKYHFYQGDELNPRQPIIVEEWHDPYETPSEAIARLNAEVVELAKLLREHGIDA